MDGGRLDAPVADMDGGRLYAPVVDMDGQLAPWHSGVSGNMKQILYNYRDYTIQFIVRWRLRGFFKL
jgi:hypothetical protein